MAIRRSSPLLVFALLAFAWIIGLTLVWSKVSPWTSYPVAVLTHVALERGAPMWVRSVQKGPGHMLVESAIGVPVPEAGGRIAEIDVEADPGRYAYGLPIFLALIFAARDRHLVAKAVVGYLLLLPAQAFSATMFVLMQMVITARSSTRTLVVDAWQVEAIVYGYQLGSLVIPTLVPILLWLWLDRQFFQDVVIRSWQAGGKKAEMSASAARASVGAPQAPAVSLPESSQSESPKLPAGPNSASGAVGEMPLENPLISSSASAGLPPRR